MITTKITKDVRERIGCLGRRYTYTEEREHFYNGHDWVCAILKHTVADEDGGMQMLYMPLSLCGA